MRPHSISYHCKIGAAFPQERGEVNLVRNENATSHSRGVYTPPIGVSQYEVEGIIRKFRTIHYCK